MKDNWSFIAFFVDKMHRAAGKLHAMVKRLMLSFQTRERRQQRRMNVDDPIREPPNGVRPEDPHESRQDHGGGAGLLDSITDLPREGVTVTCPLHDGVRNPGVIGAVQPAHPCPIGEDQDDTGPEPAGPLGVDERLEVGAGTRDEDGDVDGGDLLDARRV